MPPRGNHAGRAQARERAKAAGAAQASRRGAGAKGGSRATFVGGSTPTPLSGTPGLGGIGIGSSSQSGAFGGSGGQARFAGSPAARPAIGDEDHGEVLITRRRLLLGAVGIGALAVIGGGTAAVVSSGNSTPTVSTLQVPQGNVTNATSLDQVDDAGDCVSQTGEYDLPYGTLVFCNDDKYAACLIPTDGAKPLCRIAMLSLSSGNYETVVDKAQGQDSGFEIYDVRATSQAIIWTEANILDGIWRVMTGKLNSDASSVTGVQQVDEGACGETETPNIAAVGSNLFWQVMPQSSSTVPASRQTLQIKRAQAGSSNAEVIYESTGRAATAPYAAGDALVVTPRNPDSTSCYQLTRIDGASGEVTDTLTLPASMKPIEAGWGVSGFNFAFDATYSYGDGIANLGTYTPANKPSGSYDDAKWIRFDRTPTCAPAWCGNFFMVKSTKAVCGVDADGKRYFVLDVPSGADDWGEWLASSGANSTVVTYASINYTSTSGDETKCCRVRVWKAK